MAGGCWGWCGGELVLGAGRLLRVYRRSFCGISVFSVVFSVRSSGFSGRPWWHGLVGLRRRALLHLCRAPSFSGRPWWRGGKWWSRREFGGGSGKPLVSSVQGKVEDWWLRGEGALAVLVHRPSIPSPAAGGFCGLLHEWGAFFPGMVVACGLLLRRCVGDEVFSRRCGGSAFGLASSSGVAVVLSSWMLALEAIYGDKLEILGEKSVPRSFQIHVHCEIPDGISVSAELLQDVHDYPNNWFTFRVEHLAPISLTCVMPPSYPSHHPPYFTLSVQWLDRAKVSSLCHMLDSIWAQQPGQEVVFEWVQWLQSSMLSHLGFDGGIIIRRSDSTMDPVDVRVVGAFLSAEEIVEGLISYSEEQCQELFLHGLHVCMICLREYAGIDFIKLPCCHYFCSRCMETYSKMHVKEGSVLKLVCPDDQCGGFVPPNLLKSLLGDEDFKRWERLILQRTLDSMTDVSYCPRCETPCLEDEGTAQCSKCHFNFCTRCRDRRHIGTKCITPEEKLLSLQERGKVPNLSKGNTGRKMNVANEIFSIKEILRSCVACPHCGTAISRASGCDHILCRNCDKSFCYSCGKALNEDHTSEQCKIDREKLRVEVKVNDVVKQMQKDLGLTLSRAHPCSNCHQPNFKVGNNNHIFCGTCQIHYCALCQKRVYKSTEHFGPRGCKQHTADLDFV